MGGWERGAWRILRSGLKASVSPSLHVVRDLECQCVWMWGWEKERGTHTPWPGMIMTLFQVIKKTIINAQMYVSQFKSYNSIFSPSSRTTSWQALGKSRSLSEPAPRWRAQVPEQSTRRSRFYSQPCTSWAYYLTSLSHTSSMSNFNSELHTPHQVTNETECATRCMG